MGFFNNFVFEHQSGCCATEPGYAGDIGTIDIWLIDWLIDFLWSVINQETCGTQKVIDGRIYFIKTVFS